MIWPPTDALTVLATVIGVITGALTIFGHPIAAALLSIK
jgi:hypothetical protein